MNQTLRHLNSIQTDVKNIDDDVIQVDDDVNHVVGVPPNVVGVPQNSNPPVRINLWRARSSPHFSPTLASSSETADGSESLSVAAIRRWSEPADLPIWHAATVHSGEQRM